MTINTEHFKELLAKELALLEGELSTIGRKNPTEKGDWETLGTEIGADKAEEGDVADSIEEFDNNNAVLNQLEVQLKEVKGAIERISEGTYGVCEVCGEEIEQDRLEANPSAKTCKQHMNE